jgi:hypothetical protein
MQCHEHLLGRVIYPRARVRAGFTAVRHSIGLLHAEAPIHFVQLGPNNVVFQRTGVAGVKKLQHSMPLDPNRVNLYSVLS